MKINKKILVSLISIGILCALAIPLSNSSGNTASITSPEEILADLTGQSVKSISDERLHSGLAYADLAVQYGVLDEFNEQMVQSNKGFLQQAIDEGKISEEEAEDIIEGIVKTKEVCNISENGCF